MLKSLTRARNGASDGNYKALIIKIALVELALQRQKRSLLIKESITNDYAIILVRRRKRTRKASCKKIVISLINCFCPDITLNAANN